MEPETKKSKALLWWVIFLLAFIVAVATWLVWRNQGSEGLNNLAAVGPAGSTATSTFPARLALSEQVPGEVVYVEVVEVDAPAWVAIHQDQAGQPGKILGAGYFDSQVKRGAVDLGEALLGGRNYYAVLYHDSLADQKFSSSTEVPWLDQNNQPLVIPFSVANSLAEDKG